MFACIYGQIVCKNRLRAAAEEAMLSKGVSLVDLAFTFSPLVEETTVGTVVLDVEGQELLFGSPLNGNEADIGWAQSMAAAIARYAAHQGLKINVGVARNPDAAIHAARSSKGITVIPPGKELTRLGDLSLKMLDYSLARIEKDRAEEIGETLALWGLRTFSDFAGLPVAGVAQRLGQEGLRLQKLAQGRSERHLILVQTPTGFEQSIELEHPVAELEPLSFILARLLNQLCASLSAQALAMNELRLRLKLENRTEHERTITLPVPMRNPRTLLRLLLLDIEAHPPPASITAVAIAAAPVKPRVLQNGLFIPLAPEPEKLELTLARLAKLVGANNIGSPGLLDTHRPDAFRMKRFNISPGHNKSSGNRQSPDYRGPRRGPIGMVANRQYVMGFRMFRPRLCAEIGITRDRPTRISARSASSSCIVRGKITCASGPWRSSGDWWRADVWARDEWDVAVSGSDGGQSEVLCRIYRDLSNDAWFLEGMYD